MRKILFPMALLALAACGGQPVERPRLAKEGQQAPELTLPKLINAPVSSLSGWGGLNGKVVVLEFWATWCEPCAEYLPELNLLAERFRGKPVVFIHITDESEADARAFLAQNKMDGWVAPEAPAAVFKAFRVYGRPHTVLIGRDGKVAGFPRGDLDAEAIMRLLAGQYTPPEAGAPPLSTGTALGEFYLARSAAHSGTAQYGPASLTASAMSLEYALEWVYGRVDRFDIKPEAAAAMAASYDIRLRLPVAQAAQKNKFLLDGLEASLGLKVRRSQQEAEVLVLRKAPGGPVNVMKRQGYGGAELNGATLEVKGASFSVLAARLKEIFGQPVLDETGEAGPYEYRFEFDTADLKTMDLRLQGHLGLRLQRLRRKINVVEISRVPNR
jgi:cytochrome c biogenesis protein CcmG/thiol:disulfide interchange protein DsbE